MRRLFLSAAGGIIIPIMYFAIFSGLIAISDKWVDDSLQEKLLMPLFWPAYLITYLISRDYTGDTFSDFHSWILALTILLDFVTYSLLTYFVIVWLAKRNSLR